MSDSSSPPDDLQQLHPAGGWSLIALLFGAVGALLGLLVALVFSTVGDVNRLAGSHLPQQRGLLGLVAVVFAIAGVILAFSRPGVAAALLVLASALLVVAFHLYGLIASPFLLVAALLIVVGRIPSDPTAE